ncbi:MAG: DUF3592 domain-containing protein [Planctomycetia bacterium]|nr:DUF3592 domain-containing protein [Planctomycetia bacterium]
MCAEEYEDDYRSELEDDAADDGSQEAEHEEVAPEHVIEPELQQPTPRTVKQRMGVHVVRWILLLVLILVPGGLTLLGRNSQANWTALRDHGVDAIARVVGKTARKTGKNGHAPRANYAYFVDGMPHNLSIDLSDHEYNELRMGTELKVAYLPEKPGVAKPRATLDGGGTYASEAIGLWVVAGVVALIVLGGLIYAERLRSRRLALARDGTAIAASTLDIARVSLKKNNTQWKIAYTFEHQGETLEGKATLEQKVVQPLLTVTNPGATVLYDPYDPRRHELYLGVQQSVTVLKRDQGMSGYGNG